MSLQAVSVKIEPVLGAAVGIEVDRVALPHGESIGPILVRHLFDLARLQVVDPNVLRHPSLVAFPSAEIAKDSVISDSVPVGRKRRQPTFVERESIGQSAVEADRVELAEPVVERVAPGKIQNVLGIRKPVDDLVVDAHAFRKGSAAGVNRQLLRIAAFGGHGVDVKIAVVLTRKADPLAVRREFREKFQARMRGDAPRHPARPRHQPQVAAVTENNLVFGNVGEPHEPAFGRLRGPKVRGG